MTDKGSSWLGPLVAAALHQWLGNMRYSFFYIFIVMAAPLPALLRINAHKGAAEAVAFAESMLVAEAGADGLSASEVRLRKQAALRASAFASVEDLRLATVDELDGVEMTEHEPEGGGDFVAGGKGHA